MSKKLKNTLKTILFVGFGVLIFWLVYRDFDFSNFADSLKQINFWWLLPASVISLLSHISRARRWQLLMETEQGKPGFSNTFFAVLNAYFANLAIPRLGEVSRCAVISKYENQNFSKTLGTVVSERLIDFVMLILLAIIAFATQTDILQGFLSQHPEVQENIASLFSPTTIIVCISIVLLAIILLVLILKGKFNRFSFFEKLSKFIKNFWQGFICLKHAKSKSKILFHSFAIWILYFLMLYFCFFAFDYLCELDILAALMLFVAGSLGMLVPSPNGMGSYHFMIIQTLLLYGISTEEAASFALVAHGLQTALIIVFGVASTIMIPIFNKKRDAGKREK
ncbi:MAG: flippase-like domain-containing protein [Bacteroidales bacterium]|nr:flippase-like domain-containing protein [Bacteroidales bacterium]